MESEQRIGQAEAGRLGEGRFLGDGPGNGAAATAGGAGVSRASGPRADGLPRPVDVLQGAAGLAYWASVLVLLVGMWVMIDPGHRRPGPVGHIYITLVAFELYTWLLLGLGRWQLGRGWRRDAGRSGMFALVLSGFVFHVLNELHMAAPGQGYLLAVVAVGLTLGRLWAANRWLRLGLGRAVVASCAGWVVLMAGPPVVIRLLAETKEHQYLAAYVVCWLMATYAGGHVLLVAWQRGRGWGERGGAFGRWWTGWVVVAVLAGLTVAQLYVVLRGMYVDEAQWYFIPVYLAAGVVAVCLAQERGGKARGNGWAVLVIAVLHAAVFWTGGPEMAAPAALEGVAGGLLVHPFYTNAGFAVGLVGFAWMVLRQVWQLVVVVAGPAGYGAARAVQWAWKWQYGKGLALLVGAFVLLGAGVVLQYYGGKKSEILHSKP